ncbi:MAG: hypothetical protein ACO3DT_07105 [Gammaproteobacteria bacterium]|jgi:hypothetical protein
MMAGLNSTGPGPSIRASIYEARQCLGLESEGSFQTYELDFRYRFNERFMIGAGVVRSSIDVTAEDTDWNGRIADTHRGFLVSGSFYLD